MIKFENTEVMGWEHAIRGMRNPMNSWEKSDSQYCSDYTSCGDCPVFNLDGYGKCGKEDGNTYNKTYVIGPNDLKLMKQLRDAGPDHRKFMRMIVVYVDITAPLYWWKEFDTYKVGTVSNSCSTMHKIHEKEFTINDFSHEHLMPYGSHALVSIISILNGYRIHFLETKDKKYWWQMIQLLPSSYNQKRTVMLNYEVLAGIYQSRKGHKLDEWSGKSCFVDLVRNCNTCVKLNTKECHNGKEGGFIQWIESLPYSELITGKKEKELVLSPMLEKDYDAKHKN